MEHIDLLVNKYFNQFTWEKYPWKECTHVQLQSIKTGTLVLTLPEETKFRHIPFHQVKTLQQIVGFPTQINTTDELESVIQQIIEGIHQDPESAYLDPFLINYLCHPGLIKNGEEESEVEADEEELLIISKMQEVQYRTIERHWEDMSKNFEINDEGCPNNKYMILDVFRKDGKFIVLTKGETNEEYMAYLTTISGHGERLMKIINRIFDKGIEETENGEVNVTINCNLQLYTDLIVFTLEYNTNVNGLKYFVQEFSEMDKSIGRIITSIIGQIQ